MSDEIIDMAALDELQLLDRKARAAWTQRASGTQLDWADRGFASYCEYRKHWLKEWKLAYLEWRSSDPEFVSEVLERMVRHIQES